MFIFFDRWKLFKISSWNVTKTAIVALCFITNPTNDRESLPLRYATKKSYEDTKRSIDIIWNNFSDVWLSEGQ